MDEILLSSVLAVAFLLACLRLDTSVALHLHVSMCKLASQGNLTVSAFSDRDDGWTVIMVA